MKPAIAFLTLILMYNYAYSQDLLKRIKSANQQHPRLLINKATLEEIKLRVKKDPQFKGAYKRLIDIAEVILKTKPGVRKMKGKRLLDASRTVLKRVLFLSLAYHFTGDKKMLERAKEEMLAAAAFSDWNPSHFLDVAEMTTGMALGYDWLFDSLDKKSKAIIKKAIINKGLKAYLTGYSKKKWWIRTENNWNQVCNGGITLGALAILEDEPALTEKILRITIKHLPIAMKEFAPHGVYPEGPTYWKYGTTYNVLMIGALESALGSDFGLIRQKGFLKSADFILHTTAPSGRIFNYSDSWSLSKAPEVLLWFAKKRNDRSILWSFFKNFDHTVEKIKINAKQSNRFFPLFFIWADSLKVPAPPTIKHWKGDGVTPVAAHRSGWKDENETYVGLKGGSPGSNHAHMDIGSFIVESEGVRWAIDLGMQSYFSLESKGIKLWDKSQGSQRWSVFRTNNFSHNTLVVDGKKQKVKGKGVITNFKSTGPSPYTILNMSSVYKDQLASTIRGVYLSENRSVVIQDEIKGLNKPSSVRWGMMTKAIVKIKNNKELILQQNGQELCVKIISPSNVTWKVIDAEKPKRDYDAINKNAKMIIFTVKLKASESKTITVQLQSKNQKQETIVLKPLGKWGMH
ncbi:MAG: heparinase [Planctomycetota bacterium]|nr:MAG: heparinase [Planctomycetota bacterium]